MTSCGCNHPPHGGREDYSFIYLPEHGSSSVSPQDNQWKSRFDRISVQIYTVCVLEVNKHKHCCLQQSKVTFSSCFGPYPGMCSFDSSPLITAVLQLQTSFWHTFASACGATAWLFFFKVKRLVKTHHRASRSTPADSSWSRREQLMCVFIDFSKRRRHTGSCSFELTTTNLVEYNTTCRLEH